MKQTIWVAVLLVSFVGQGWAQLSSAPQISRFEIVLSDASYSVRLKIDKYTGNVFRLVKDKDSEEFLWEPIWRFAEDEVVANKVNYQVVTSGASPYWTFLINVNTGASWQLLRDNESGTFWWSALE